MASIDACLSVTQKILKQKKVIKYIYICNSLIIIINLYILFDLYNTIYFNTSKINQLTLACILRY